MKRFEIKSSGFTTVLLSALLGLNFACQPNQGGPSAPVKSPAQNFTGGGTVSGGGENGIDGHPVEYFSTTSIDNLPEYRHFIAPILRRMSQGKPDVFIMYLNWVVHQKVWYFVPVELPNIPRERTKLAFESSQQAIHTEREIFIHAPSYKKMPAPEKAMLLLHEMVMGARYLMKQKPDAQCKALARVGERDLCDSPEAVKFAQNFPYDAEDSKSLNGLDTEAVRAMTTFLLTENQDLSGPSVAAERARLQYVFPWEKALSYVGGSELRDTIQRTVTARDRFHYDAPNVGANSECTMELNANAQSGVPASGFQFTVSSKIFGPGSTVTTDYLVSSWINIDRTLTIDSAGAFDPSGSGQVVDLVKISPLSQWTSNFPCSFADPSTCQDISTLIEFYISRDERPKVLEVRLVPVQKMFVASARAEDSAEYVPVSTIPVQSCRLIQ